MRTTRSGYARPVSATDEDRLDLSVVICVLNGESVIGSQLAALAHQQADFSWEVLVVDNGCTDGTLGVVDGWRQRFPVPLRVVEASDRRGIGHARNAGAHAARGVGLAYCDCDDVVQPGWLSAARDALGQWEVAAGVNQELSDPLDPQAAVLNPWVLQGSAALQGCNFAIRRETLVTVGGFDEAMPPYGNDDSELALRLRKAGVSMGAAPAMRIWFRRTTGLRARLRKVYQAGLSEVIVWHRHRDLFGDRLSLRRLVLDVVGWPVQAVRDRRAMSRETLARQSVVRVARLVGYLTLVRTGRAGGPQLMTRDADAAS